MIICWVPNCDTEATSVVMGTHTCQAHVDTTWEAVHRIHHFRPPRQVANPYADVLGADPRPPEALDADLAGG